MSRIRSRQVESEAVPTRVLRKDAASSEKIQTHSVRWNKEQWPGGPKVRQGDLSPGVVELIEEKAAGGGTPSTITLHAEVEVASGVAEPVEFADVLEAEARRNLFPLDLPVSAVPLPYAGTWEVTIWHVWDLTPSFRGGGTVALTLDGAAVWPLSPEATVGTPEDAYDLPRFEGSVTVVAYEPGETLEVLVGQGSGETQSGTLVVEVALREPQGVGQEAPPPAPSWPSLVVGGWIAFAASEDASRMYVVANGVVEELTFPARVTSGRGIAWSPNRTELAISHANASGPKLTVVSTATGAIADGWETFDEGTSELQGVAYSPDGSLLALAGVNSNPGLRIVDTEAKSLLVGVPTTEGYSSGSGWPYDVAFSPDGTRLAVAFNGDPQYAVIDLATLTIETGWPNVLSGNGRSVNWSPDGSLLVLGGNSAQLKFLDVATKTDDTANWSSLTGSVGGFARTAFSPDGSKLAVIYATGSTAFRVYDVATKQQESGWPSFTDGGSSVAWFGDTGERLAVATSEPYLTFGRLPVFDTAQKTAEVGWPVETEPVSTVAFAWDPGNVSRSG